MRRLFAGAAVVALALPVAACGSGSSPRARVSAYFRQVNRIEHDLAPQMDSANIAFRRFAAERVTPKELRELEHAHRTIAVLEHRLSRLTPPKQAERIQHDLLRLVSLQESFAKDVVRLAAYGPQVNAVLTRVAAADARLKRALRTKSALGQSSAFRVYAHALQADVGRLDKLDPPPVAAPSQHEEATRLARAAHVSLTIAAALKPIKPPVPLPKKQRQNRHAVARYNRQALAYEHHVLSRRRRLNALLGQLGSVSSLADRRRVRAAQAKAVKAFNRRLLVIGRLAGRIERERIQLERRL